jgi:hypothetical protein
MSCEIAARELKGNTVDEQKAVWRGHGMRKNNTSHSRESREGDVMGNGVTQSSEEHRAS